MSIRKKYSIAERRHRLTDIIRSRPEMHNAEIAKEMGCSTDTIRRDQKYLLKIWREENIDVTDLKLRQNLHKLDQLIEAALPVALLGNEKDGTRTGKPDMIAINTVNNLLTRQAKLLGLDQPIKQEIEHKINIDREKTMNRLKDIMADKEEPNDSND